MCSPPRSAASSSPSTPSGTRTGRPPRSSAVVASAISSVRFSATVRRLRIRDDPALPPRQPLLDVHRELLVRLRDGQLFHGVMRLGIGVQRLAHLFGTREAAA